MDVKIGERLETTAVRELYEETGISKNDITDMEHWSVSPDGLVIDTYDKLTRVIQVEEIEFFD